MNNERLEGEYRGFLENWSVSGNIALGVYPNGTPIRTSKVLRREGQTLYTTTGYYSLGKEEALDAIK